MTIIPENDFNQQYVRNGYSVGLSGLGAVYGRKVLKWTGYKLNHAIEGENTISEVRNNNEAYKIASETIIKRDNINFADLSVAKDAFKKGADPEFDKLRQKKARKITSVLNSNISRVSNIFKTKKKIQKEINLREKNCYEGKNACVKYNKIFANFKEAAFMIPHEIGHVKNYESRGFAKCLQKMREPWFNKIGLGLAFGGAIFLTPQNDINSSKSENNFLIKAKTFIKKHCVAIGTIAVLPVILEEGLASFKAHKLTKNILSKPDLKAMNKANSGALLSYIFVNFATVGGIYIADKVRNHTAPQN